MLMIMMIHIKSVIVVKCRSLSSPLPFQTGVSEQCNAESCSSYRNSLTLGMISLVVVFPFSCEVHGSILS